MRDTNWNGVRIISENRSKIEKTMIEWRINRWRLQLLVGIQMHRPEQTHKLNRIELSLRSFHFVPFLKQDFALNHSICRFHLRISHSFQFNRCSCLVHSNDNRSNRNEKKSRKTVKKTYLRHKENDDCAFFVFDQPIFDHAQENRRTKEEEKHRRTRKRSW